MQDEIHVQAVTRSDPSIMDRRGAADPSDTIFLCTLISRSFQKGPFDILPDFECLDVKFEDLVRKFSSHFRKT